ncbi:Phage holin family Hol44, holin superfamily V [Cohnella sp. OV330]|uniref:phage holin family protein n=1 Tax=Cohnella sp. OV330 TaxID=1855288 RepID=UPI0008E59C08|nr:phage holin family protein [Cohnella sp. OV330]SFA91350.1 Phage holin family Hol44, holin superfamily V [Cohnella sp. OV330]
MEWTAINELLDPALLIVIAANWVLGYIVKRTPRVPDWSIIYIVTVFSIAFTVATLGVSALSLLQGFLAGAVAVYGNQFAKQAVKAAGGDGNDI